jgi:hypothetical protein
MCVGIFPPIVLRESGVKIVCNTAVMPPGVCLADEYVNAVESLHLGTTGGKSES